MRPTIEAMRQHVDDLLASLSRADDYVEVRWTDSPKRAWATIEAGIIAVPRVRSAVSYATALHELGHFLGRHQRSRSRLMRERWAWIWAERNALLWTPAMARDAQECVAWYAARMEDDGKVGLCK